MLRLIWGGLFFLTANMCEAGVNMSIDDPDYWAGTNARAKAFAQITSPTLGITAARIVIDGNIVWSKTYPAGPLYRIYVSPHIMFDTSQFDYLDYVEAKLEVKTTDSPTVWNSISHSTYVKNQATILTQDGLSYSGESRLESAYEGINYNVAIRHDDWTLGEWEDEVETVTAVDMNAHGGLDIHMSGDGVDGITSTEYADVKSNIMGMGLPPFNSGNWPPFNFIHLNVCNCFDSGSNWMPALFPAENYYVGYAENQAVMGYSVFTWDTFHLLTSDAVMDALESGRTVSWAKSNVVDYETTYVSDLETDSTYTRLILPADIHIAGDDDTRLSYVYTADSTLPVARYRTISE